MKACRERYAEWSFSLHRGRDGVLDFWALSREQMQLHLWMMSPNKETEIRVIDIGEEYVGKNPQGFSEEGINKRKARVIVLKAKWSQTYVINRRKKEKGQWLERVLWYLCHCVLGWWRDRWNKELVKRLRENTVGEGKGGRVQLIHAWLMCETVMRCLYGKVRERKSHFQHDGGTSKPDGNYWGSGGSLGGCKGRVPEERNYSGTCGQLIQIQADTLVSGQGVTLVLCGSLTIPFQNRFLRLGKCCCTVSLKECYCVYSHL